MTTKGATRRVLANAGWMLGGQGAAAAMSLVYLALATRSLGLEGFGTFSMILAIASTVATLVAFQCWQIVVHYGMDHLHAGRDDDLARLLWFCAGLDALGVAFGSMISLATVAAVAGPLGWDSSTTWAATVFCLLTMMGFRSTPVGVLRLHNRYATAAGAETIAPVLKTIGAVGCWWFDAGLPGFLIVWALADVAVSIAYWFIAAAHCGAPWRPGSRPEMRGVRSANEGILRYALATNATASLKIASRSLAILVVGWFGGSTAAGAYRLCLQLSQAAARVSQVISRALFPELARARLSGVDQLRTMLWRTSRLVAALGLVAAIAIPLLGNPLLTLVGGAAYAAAYPTLLVMGAAAVVEMTGSALEPTLLALGRGGAALRASIAAAVTTLVLMIPAASTNADYGAAWAVLAGAIVAFATSAWSLRPLLTKSARDAIA